MSCKGQLGLFTYLNSIPHKDCSLLVANQILCVYVRACVYVRVCVCVRVCMHVRGHVCVHVCECMRACVLVYAVCQIVNAKRKPVCKAVLYPRCIKWFKRKGGRAIHRCAPKSWCLFDLLLFQGR